MKAGKNLTEEVAAGQPNHVASLKAYCRNDNAKQCLQDGMALRHRANAAGESHRERKGDHDQKVAI